MNPGDRLCLKKAWKPSLHAEVDSLELSKGTEGIVEEPDEEHPDAGKILVTFPTYNFHWAFEKDELASLFTLPPS